MQKRNWVFIVFALMAGLLFVAAWLILPVAAESPTPEKSSPGTSSPNGDIPSNAPSSPNAVLYDQYNNPSSIGSNSQKFETSLSSFDDLLADDFVVPPGQVWRMDRVDVQGQYYNGSGPAASANVFIFTNAITTPNTLIASRQDISYTTGSEQGSFILPLSQDVILGPGAYWLSVQANQTFSTTGQWAWNDRTITTTHPAVWQNPAGGFGVCPSWRLRTLCVGDGIAADQVFRLSGSSSPLPTVHFNTAAYSVNENGGSVAIKVVLSAASPLTATVVYNTANYTAAGGSDFIAAGGVLTFTPGVTSQSFNISIINDTSYEGNETFRLVLSSPTGAGLASPNPATVTILDNETLPALTCGFKTPGPWKVRNFLPQPVYGLSAVSDGTYAYALGGYNIQDNVVVTQAVRYNPATNLWSGIKAVPKPLLSASAVYAPINNKLYVFGGQLNLYGQVVTSTLIYNITSNTWSSGAPMPAARAFMGGGYYKGKIYLTGGYSTGSVADAHDQTWEYNVLANTWLTKTNMTEPLGGPASAVVNGHLYIIGGRDISISARTQTYDYDIAHDTWSTRLPIPIGINVPGTAVLKDKILVIGGGTPFLALDGSSSLGMIRAPETSGTTLVFDPALNSWAAGPGLNVQRSFIGATGFGDFAVAMGGYNGSSSDGTAEVLWECPTLYAPVIWK